MNFNFKQANFSFTPPMRRHYSTMGLTITKPERSDFASKSENLFMKVLNLGPGVLQNKSFSNPNFVNKQNPNVFASRAFDSPHTAHSIYEHVRNSCVIQQPPKIPEENQVVYQPATESSQRESQMPVHSEVPKSSQETQRLLDPGAVSPKSTKKSGRSRRNRRGKRTKQEPQAPDPGVGQKPKMTQRKPPKTLCSLPKRMKKDAEFARHRGRKGRRGKPWHKISLGMEIMECDEPSVVSPQSPNCPGLEPARRSICIEWSTPVDISAKCNPDYLSSASEHSSSPASPAIRRLRMPSECDSEDSFIVFGDEVSSCTSDTEDPCTEDDALTDSDTDLDVVHFCENISLTRDPGRKKVCFKVDSELCDVHPMVHWNFAYQKARVGPWEQYARDRARFESRISKTESILSCVLQPDHREKIYRERFDNPD